MVTAQFFLADTHGYDSGSYLTRQLQPAPFMLSFPRDTFDISVVVTFRGCICMASSFSRLRATLNHHRALLLSASAGADTLVPVATASDSAKTAPPRGTGNCSTLEHVVATAQSARVRGHINGGVLTFKGVPLEKTKGVPTLWMPAIHGNSSKGIRPTLTAGASCCRRRTLKLPRSLVPSQLV